MHKVWLLLLPGFPLVDVSSMLTVFEAANAAHEREDRESAYEVHLASVSGGPVLSSSGVPLSTNALPPQLVGRANTLVVTRRPELLPATSEAANALGLNAWLMSSRGHLVRCAVLETGSPSPPGPDNGVVPRQRAPVVRASLQVRERAASFTERIATHGWPSIEPGQGLDLALSWIEEDWGEAFANTLASNLPYPRSQRYGAKRYRSPLIEQPSDDARLTALHQWIAMHLREDLSIQRLAKQIHMSTRSFARFYVRATGLTPGCGVQQIRLDSACRLIETSTRPLKAIAAQCGYGSQEVMRRAFVRGLKMTPREYRRLHAVSTTTSALPSS